MATMSTVELRPCQVPECSTKIPPGLVMCDRHWELVAPDLRRKIYRFFHLIRAGKLESVRAEYDAAMEAAIRQVLEATYAATRL